MPQPIPAPVIHFGATPPASETDDLGARSLRHPDARSQPGLQYRITTLPAWPPRAAAPAVRMPIHATSEYLRTQRTHFGRSGRLRSKAMEAARMSRAISQVDRCRS